MTVKKIKMPLSHVSMLTWDRKRKQINFLLVFYLYCTLFKLKKIWGHNYSICYCWAAKLSIPPPISVSGHSPVSGHHHILRPTNPKLWGEDPSSMTRYLSKETSISQGAVQQYLSCESRSSVWWAGAARALSTSSWICKGLVKELFNQRYCTRSYPMETEERYIRLGYHASSW